MKRLLVSTACAVFSLSAQNDLLAKLAAMEKDVVTK